MDSWGLGLGFLRFRAFCFRRLWVIAPLRILGNETVELLGSLAL